MVILLLLPGMYRIMLPRFLAGCKTANIPVEEISIGEMLREEPLLNPHISRCFRVPDASADSFLAADSNAESARQLGRTNSQLS